MHWLLENQSEQDNLSLFSVPEWEFVTASSYSFPFLASFMEESPNLILVYQLLFGPELAAVQVFPFLLIKCILVGDQRPPDAQIQWRLFSPYLIWPSYDSCHSILPSTSLFPWFGGTTLSWCLIFRLLHWLLLHLGIFSVFQGSNS